MVRHVDSPGPAFPNSTIGGHRGGILPWKVRQRLYIADAAGAVRDWPNRANSPIPSVAAGHIRSLRLHNIRRPGLQDPYGQEFRCGPARNG